MPEAWTRLRPVTYHECSRVQTGLVIVALKICSSEPVNCPIVPPNEATYDGVEHVRADRIGPEPRSVDVLGRKLHEVGDFAVIGALVILFDQDNRQKYTKSNHTENEKHVPQHPQKAQEDDSVQAHPLNHFKFFHVFDGTDPTEKAFIDGRRGMLFVGMFCSRSINSVGPGTEEAECSG